MVQPSHPYMTAGKPIALTAAAAAAKALQFSSVAQSCLTLCVETVTDFIFLGSKITADGDCSHEIKRCSLLGRKAMTNLDSILKSRDIPLPKKVRLVKAMVFP